MMNGNFTFRRFLTDLLVWAVVFTVFVLTPFHPAHSADTDTTPIITPTSNAQNEQDTPLDADARQYQINQMMHYIRHDIPNMLPGIPSYIRDPAGWMMGGMREMRDELSLERSDDGEQSLVGQVAQPVLDVMQPPATHEGEAMWLSPDYHHMGFLPAHDAMVMGVGMRHTMMGGGMQVQVRPFVGQNWHGAGTYSGAETAINLTGASGHPWGKIAVRYIEGDPDMLDNGHGTDLHAELRFNDHLALHAGVRQSDDESLGNYVLLRWRLAELSPLSATH